MKIDGSNRVKGGTVRRTGRGDSATGNGFAKQISGDVSGPAGVQGTPSLGGIDGLLALQEVDDATARASHGKQRARLLLQQLDELRLALLAGDLPRAKLADLSRAIQSRKVQVDDPHLAEILDEIDLRAQVELAKYGP